jgi:hypothetical protein
MSAPFNSKLGQGACVDLLHGHYYKTFTVELVNEFDCHHFYPSLTKSNKHWTHLLASYGEK